MSYGRIDIINILMDRDGINYCDAEDCFAEAKAEFDAGGDPEEICKDYFGLEPDYCFALME